MITTSILIIVFFTPVIVAAIAYGWVLWTERKLEGPIDMPTENDQ